MDYELKKTKREKSSIVPIEEVFTDLDIRDNDPYEPSIGYRFDTPRRWSQDKSRNKSIGIRDLKLTPSSGDFRCRFLSYANIGFNTQHATWKENHYEISNDKTFHDLTNPVKLQVISDIINYSITPSNNFEEIITDIINNHLNQSSWKGIKIEESSCYNYPAKVHQTNRGLFYVKETVSGEESSFKAMDYVLNTHWLKIPLYFNYHYDSNNSFFQTKITNDARGILMTNTSQSNNDLDTNIYEYSQDNIGNAYKYQDMMYNRQRFHLKLPENHHKIYLN